MKVGCAGAARLLGGHRRGGQPGEAGGGVHGADVHRGGAAAGTAGPVAAAQQGGAAKPETWTDIPYDAKLHRLLSAVALCTGRRGSDAMLCVPINRRSDTGSWDDNRACSRRQLERRRCMCRCYAVLSY